MALNYKMTLGWAGTYTGPGDVVAAVFWHGLRAYNGAAASAARPAIRIVDGSGNFGTDIHVTAVAANALGGKAGGLLASDITTWQGLHGTTMLITTVYDQVTYPGGQDITQATVANMPTLNTTGFKSTLPSITGGGSTLICLRGPSTLGPYSQPFSAYILTTTGADAHPWAFGNTSGFVGLQWLAGINTLRLNTLSGSAPDVTTTSSNWTCSIASLLDSTSGTHQYVNGADTTAGTTGGGNVAASAQPAWFGDPWTNVGVCQMIEGGFYSSNITGSDAALYANITSYYGTLP